MELWTLEDAVSAPDDVDVALHHVAQVAASGGEAGAIADRIREFVAGHPTALHRSCVEAHLTGSALVVDHLGQNVVLLHHAKLRRWLQPGGHADGEGNLARVALTESSEETGIDDLRVVPVPIDADIHRVAPPGEQPHLHLDVRFLVVAPGGAVLRTNHESTGSRWVSFAHLEAHDPDPGLRRLARAGRRLLDRSPPGT